MLQHPGRRFAIFVLIGALICPGAIAGASAKGGPAAPNAGLSDETILIVRHGEKPDAGPGLTPAGEERARAYVGYFTGFRFSGKSLRPRYLIAAKDSRASQRPRLTIEPLSRALNLPIHQPFADKEFGQLAADLQTHRYGKVILIAWHHGEIPALIRALGVEPSTVLPAPKWPPSEFGWLVVIRYDRAGRPRHAALIRENLMPDDGASH